MGKFGNIEIIPTEDEVNVFISEVEGKEFEGFEATEEAFYRYQRHNKYSLMLKAAIILAEENHPKKKLFIELSAKRALEMNDSQFAWCAALYAEKV